MHILLGIAAVLAAAIFWIHRIRSASDAVRDVTDAVESVGGAIRRSRFRRKAETNPLDLIADPREAAVVLLVGLARVDGDLTERQRLAIERAAIDVMQLDKPTETIARARWLTNTVTDPSNLVLRFTRLFQATLGEPERRQLLELCRSVSGLEGPVGEIREGAIARLAERLGLRLGTERLT